MVKILKDPITEEPLYFDEEPPPKETEVLDVNIEGMLKKYDLKSSLDPQLEQEPHSDGKQENKTGDILKKFGITSSSEPQLKQEFHSDGRQENKNIEVLFLRLVGFIFVIMFSGILVAYGLEELIKPRPSFHYWGVVIQEENRLVVAICYIIFGNGSILYCIGKGLEDWFLKKIHSVRYVTVLGRILFLFAIGAGAMLILVDVRMSASLVNEFHKYFFPSVAGSLFVLISLLIGDFRKWDENKYDRWISDHTVFALLSGTTLWLWWLSWEGRSKEQFLYYLSLWGMFIIIGGGGLAVVKDALLKGFWSYFVPGLNTVIMWGRNGWREIQEQKEFNKQWIEANENPFEKQMRLKREEEKEDLLHKAIQVVSVFPVLGVAALSTLLSPFAFLAILTGYFGGLEERWVYLKSRRMNRSYEDEDQARVAGLGIGVGISLIPTIYTSIIGCVITGIVFWFCVSNSRRVKDDLEIYRYNNR